MRIVHVIDYFAPKLGYQETYLAREQQRMGHEVVVITSDRHFPFPHYEQTVQKQIGRRYVGSGRRVEEGISVIRLLSHFEFFTRVWMNNLITTIQDINPDVIHVHSVSSLTSLRLACAKHTSLRKIPILADDHSHWSIVGNHWSKKIFYTLYKYAVGWFVSRSLSSFVAITQETKEIVQRVFGITKDVSIIQLGADTKTFSFQQTWRKKLRKQFKFAERDCVFIYTGKMIHDKGIDLLVQAFIELNHPKARLMLVGNGPDEFILNLKKALKQANISDRVLWIPLQKPEHLARYYSTADVGVWPKQESVSMIEAMACELPVLVKRSKSMETRLGTTGSLMYNEGNTQDLVRSMKVFINMSTQEKRKRGKAGRAHVEKTLSWKTIAQQFVSFYSSLLSSSTSRFSLRDWYMKHIDPRHAEYLEAYDLYLRGKNKVLDVGCGVGNFIAFDPKHIEGVDHNQESLELVRKRGFRARKSGVTKLPYTKESFDGIFCGHVIEHLYPEDALSMVYEFDRILKPGGTIVMKTPLMYDRFFNDLTHIRPYPPECLMDYLMPNAQVSTQRTANRKQGARYRIHDLFYRYDFLYYPSLEPARIEDAFLRTCISLLKVCSVALYKLGIQKYWVKTGYTIVLEKLG